MKLTQRYALWVERLIDWVMRVAKRSPDITLDEYRDIEKQAVELRKRIGRQQAGRG